MNLDDPVDAAALLMFNRTWDYLAALKHDEHPDTAALLEATTGYRDALETHLRRQALNAPAILPSDPCTSIHRPWGCPTPCPACWANLGSPIDFRDLINLTDAHNLTCPGPRYVKRETGKDDNARQHGQDQE